VPDSSPDRPSDGVADRPSDGVADPRPSDGVGNRRRAREFAFRVLFEAIQSKQSIAVVYDHALEVQNQRRNTSPFAADAEQDEDGELYGEALDSNAFEFAQSLVKGYEQHATTINTTLEQVIEGWSFSQMAQTDLNILRLATTEMMFLDTPHPPVIEIAVRLAKKYGGDESGRFVNGVLARLIRRLVADAKAAGQTVSEGTSNA
jgi:transcription antitermination protein NusB